MPSASFEKLVGIQCHFARSHGADDHLAIAFEDDAVDDGGVYVFFGHQKVRRLRDRVSIFAPEKPHT